MIKRRKLKSGRYVYDVTVYVGTKTDGTRARKSVTCKTKHEAEYMEARLKAQQSAVRHKSGSIELRDYIENFYWPNASQRLEATSKDTYRTEIKLRIVPTLGARMLTDIDRAAIQHLVNKCKTETVARKCLGTLKTILNEAKADGLIITNPAQAKYKMPPKGQKRDSGVVLDSFDQIAELVETVSQNGSETVQRISIPGLLLGLRPEERYALDWEDFDLDENTVTIKAAYVIASSRHGGTQLKKTKTELSSRVIPMPPRFREWLETQGAGTGAFVPGKTTERISPSTAQKAWRRFLNANPDAPQVTLENMRHSYATSYLAAGGRIDTLSRLLGHSDINTTLRRYVRPGIESLRDDVGKTVTL